MAIFSSRNIAGLIVTIIAFIGLVAIFKTQFSPSPSITTHKTGQFDKETQSLPPSLEKIHQKVILNHGQLTIPYVTISSFPWEFKDISPIALKKELFIQITLPLILKSNEKLEKDRKRLIEILNKPSVSSADQKWIASQKQRYHLSADSADKDLLLNINIIPPSLALSQSIVETGWGTSRVSHVANAMFGQWTYDPKKGIKPKDRQAGKKHFIRKFSSLQDSVDHYMLNLNSHKAYEKLRIKRSQSEKINAIELTPYLTAYSQKPNTYPKLLNKIITSNGLARFDKFRLSDQ